MTIIIGVRVPQKGAIIMADGQVCDLDGRVWTTSATKILGLQGVTVAVAGNLMVLDELRRAKVQTADAVKTHLRKNDYACDYQLICYDHVLDEMWATNQEGFVTEHPYWAAEGIGATYAAGAFMISAEPKTLEDALHLAKQVVQVTCSLNKRCGGKTHWQVSTPLLEPSKKRFDFQGVITAYSRKSLVGKVRVGKRVFDFDATCFDGGNSRVTPKLDMKVIVDFSETGAVLAVRSRKV
jgi:hypothetical protein